MIAPRSTSGAQPYQILAVAVIDPYDVPFDDRSATYGRCANKFDVGSFDPSIGSVDAMMATRFGLAALVR